MRGGTWSAIAERIEAVDWAKLYLVVALVWGIALVVLTPPFQNFDEAAHFYRVWTVAQGHVLPVEADNPVLPASVAQLEYAFPIVPVIQGQTRVTPRLILSQLKVRFSDQQAPSASYAATYGPLGYLPQAGAVLALKTAGRSPLGTLYLGRLFNLLCAVALTYFAIRILPFAKPLLFVAALLPMSIAQMASLSPDALLLGGVFFFTALTLELSKKEEVTGRAIAGLAISGVLLLNAKPSYALIVLLLFLLTPRQLGGVRRYLLVVGGIVACSLALAAVLTFAAHGSQAVLDLQLGPHNGVNPSAQVAHVIKHPFGFLGAILATLDSHALSYGRLMVGAFAWGNVVVTDVITLVAGLGMGVIIASREHVELEPWRRGILLGVALLTSLAIFGGLYTAFTRVGGSTIEGLQGRYFLPSLLLSFLGLAGFPFGRRWLVPAAIMAVVAVLALTTLRTVILFYY